MALTTSFCVAFGKLSKGQHFYTGKFHLPRCLQRMSYMYRVLFLFLYLAISMTIFSIKLPEPHMSETLIDNKYLIHAGEKQILLPKLPLKAGYNHFTHIQTFNVENYLKMSEFWSSKTGLRIFLGLSDHLFIQGAIMFPTERRDDVGYPHILEHCLFVESQNFPFRNFLQESCLLSMSPGANAFTSLDHTAYHFQTAGEEGFKTILPIFLDHIFNPILPDGVFRSEVVHPDPTTGWGGTVYSEMQARENTKSELAYYAIEETLFSTESGRHFSNGGKLASIREANMDGIKKYHSDYYKLSNASILVVGKFDTAAILEVIAGCEAFIQGTKSVNLMGPVVDFAQKKVPQEITRQRPWHSRDRSVVLTQNITKRVEFPSPEEKCGNVRIAFRTTRYHEIQESAAIDIIIDYFTQETVSTLYKAAVESEKPWASEIHGYTFELILDNYAVISAVDVPFNKLESAAAEIITIIDAEAREDIDMDRLHDIIRMKYSQFLSLYEEYTHGNVLNIVGAYIVGGTKSEELRMGMNRHEYYRKLLEWDEKRWKEIIMKYIANNPKSAILVTPSKAKQDEIAKNIQEEIVKVNKTYGEEYFKKLKHEMEIEREISSAPPPPEALKTLPKIDIRQVGAESVTAIRNFPDNIWGLTQNDHQLTTNKNAENALHGLSLPELPFHAQAIHINSKFINIVVQIPLNMEELNQLIKWNDGSIPPPGYLTQCISSIIQVSPGYMRAADDFLASPTYMDGETLAKYRCKHMNRYDISISFGDIFDTDLPPRTVTLHLQAMPEKFRHMLAALDNYMHGVDIKEEKVRIGLKQEVARYTGKRSIPKYHMTSAFQSMMLNESAPDNVGLFPAVELATKQALAILEDSQDNSSKAVLLENIQGAYSFLFSQSKFLMSIYGDLTALPSGWMEDLKKFGKTINAKPIANHPPLLEHFRINLSWFDIQRKGEMSMKKPIILTSKAVEASRLMFSVPFDYLYEIRKIPMGHQTDSSLVRKTVDEFHQGWEDISRFSVFANYMSNSGNLFNNVRNSGAAYGVGLVPHYMLGLINLIIRPAAKPVEAYSIALKTFKDIFAGTKVIQEHELAVAVAGATASFLKSQYSCQQVQATSEIERVWLQLPKDHIIRALDTFSNVQPKHMRNILDRYLKDLTTVDGIDNERNTFGMLIPEGTASDTVAKLKSLCDELNTNKQTEFTVIDALQMHDSLRQDLVMRLGITEKELVDVSEEDEPDQTDDSSDR